MRGEIIIIGDEILSGRVNDLNGWYACGRLAAAGLRVSAISTVGDDAAEIAEVVNRALRRSDFVIVSGGLGPTEDDITAKALADILGRPLVLRDEILDQIKGYMKNSKLTWSDALEKLAWLPENAEIMDPDGHMCGFCLKEGGCSLFVLPGVPEEMRKILDKRIIPSLLDAQDVTGYYRTSTLKLFGAPEHEIGRALEGMDRDLPGLSIGYYPNFPEVHVVLTARGEDLARVEATLEKGARRAEEKIGKYIVARGDETLSTEVASLLKEHGQTLVLAESCTGGLIGHLITEMPGSSDYFERGYVVYSNRSKVEELGVPEDILKQYGAVSSQTAEAMAVGARKASGAGLALSVTGIAGPSGGSPQKPVGTVYLGMASSRGVVSKLYNFRGGRGRIKRLSAYTALNWIRRYFVHDPFFHSL